MGEPSTPLPEQISPTDLPKEASPTSLPSEVTAVDLPNDPTCVLHSGESVEIVNDGFRMPDGRILSEKEIYKCKFESGSSFYFEYTEPKIKHNKHKAVDEAVSLPVDASPTSTMLLVGDTTQVPMTNEVSVSTSPAIDNKNTNAIDPIVIAAVVAATTIVAVSASNIRKNSKGKGNKGKTRSSSKLNNLHQQQKKKEEEQKKCDGKSENVQEIIDETNKELESLEHNFLNFVGLEDNKELSESISGLKDELKKLKKVIKDFE